MSIAPKDGALLGAAGLVPGVASEPAAKLARVRLGVLTAYGLGGLSDNFAQFAINHLLLFYLTIVAGLSGTLAGLAMGTGSIVYAVVGPLVGWFSDNSHSRFGRRHQFMVIGLLPLAAGCGILYSIPPSVTGTALFGCVMVILVATWISQAMFNVPYMALGADLSDDYRERSLIVSSRLLMGSLGTALATYLAFGVFLAGHNGQTHRAAYTPLAWSCAAILVLGASISILGTFGARRKMSSVASVHKISLRRFPREIGELFQSRSFRTLFFLAIGISIAWGASLALNLHANTYFWQLTTKQIRNVALLMPLGSSMGVILAAGLSRFLQKRAVSTIGMAMMLASQLAIVPLRLAGLIDTQNVIAAVCLSTLLTSGGFSVAVVGYQSMMADAADEHEHLFGTRRQALYYSGTGFAAWAGTGIGALIAGVALDLIGFPHGLHGGAPIALAPEVIRNLGLVYGPAMAAFTVVGIIILQGYRLDSGKHGIIRTALSSRRDQTEAS